MGWFNHQLVNIFGIPRVFPGLKWGQKNPSNSKQWKFETSKKFKQLDGLSLLNEFDHHGTHTFEKTKTFHFEAKRSIRRLGR